MKRIQDMHMLRKITAIIMAVLLVLPMLTVSGCGKKDDDPGYADAVENEDDEGSEDYGEYYEASQEEGESYEAEETYVEEDPVERIKNRPQNYETDNEISESDPVNDPPISVTMGNYCDSSAIWYAEENNCEDHLLWLADYAVNCIQPQAVRKLLQIPVLREAAENGELSRYISLYITNNGVNQFGAMEQTCNLGDDGHGVKDWDSPIYSVGHRILINLNSFGPETPDDPEKLRFLESSMIHEMMHAFMADYLFNLSFGTVSDGGRVLKRDENGNMIMGEDGNPVNEDAIPRWFQEGLAMTVEDGYGTRREELRDKFGADAYTEEYLLLLSTSDVIAECVNLEFEDGEKVNAAKVTDEENTYTTGYIATMFLCSLAGEKLGMQAFDEYGTLNTGTLFYGLNDIITRIHDGNSLDSVIADISYDDASGISVYADTADFEEKCFGSAEDPGLIFMQKMIFDMEARSQKDPENYIPCASVLPGYVNSMQDCMDDAYHDPASVYQIDNINADDPNADYFSISTIRMSDAALTGGRITSYDPVGDPLSPEEAQERDRAYIGNEKKYIDIALEED